MIVMDGQPHLFEVVAAAGAVGGLAHLLDGGQKKSNQDGNDGNNDQQFDEREGQPLAVSRDTVHFRPPIRERTDRNEHATIELVATRISYTLWQRQIQ